ncbi:MAG: hypothetical protein HFE51_06670 [Clostridia bacterium]|nr:hypothetical protein [Clostridia bacterium]MCI8979259.1 hypothetical protein [Clostridia bacterium]MCI9086084.1 hypothetical protein [Clostridia bacterium]
MKKKIISLIAAGVLGVQAFGVPMVANAEEGVAYVNKSDFNDVAIGGANGTGYHGLGIIMDGSPWLSKGSASVHYQTFSYDDQRKVNYCNFYSNSDKSGSGDGAGSMYIYNRNLTSANQMGPYGYVEFDIRLKPDTQNFNFMMGWFEDPTSGGFNASTDVALSIRMGLDGFVASNGPRTATLIKPAADKWYKVRVALDMNLEEYNVTVTDIAENRVIGSLAEPAAFTAPKPAGLKGIKTTCWGYIRGNTYNYDMTNVTIARADKKYSLD